MDSVAVIGSGFAGLAALGVLSNRGIPVRLFSQGLAASEMTSGACDFEPWRQGADELPALPSLASEAVELLGQWGFSICPTRVASSEGVLRPAAGHQERVLNLEELAGGIVGVLDVGRDDWDAVSLARDWSRTAWAGRSRTRFVPIELSGVFSDAQRLLPLAAFCQLLDQPELVASWRSALSHLRSAQSTLRGLLCGPWLGTRSSPLEAEEDRGGFVVGESLSPPEGPIGSRFAAIRASWIEERKITRELCRVIRLDETSDAVRVVHRDEENRERQDAFAAVIVATGGLLGGGLRWHAPPGAGQLRAGGALSCPLDPRPPLPSGAYEGSDPTKNGGAWLAVGSAAGVPPGDPDSRIQFAGDVGSAFPGQATGTIGSAVVSGVSIAKRVAESVL